MTVGTRLAYRFLGPGGTTASGMFAWPLPQGAEPGAWVEAAVPIEDSRNEAWACRAAQLAPWVMQELWDAELAEPVVDAAEMLLSTRGRLVRRVDAWDEPAARGYAAACGLRTRDHAVTVLRASGSRHAAKRLARRDRLDAVAEAAGELTRSLDGPQARAVGYAAEAAASAATGAPALLGYFAATAAAFAAAGSLGGEGFDAALSAERAWQARWLIERLGLRPD